MKNLKFPKLKVAPLLTILAAFVAGLMGAFLMLKVAGISFKPSTSTSSSVTTSSVTYTNTNDTTEAVKKTQEAVVSVINYQTISSTGSSTLDDLYRQYFGTSGSTSDGELTVAGEGSGVIYKKDGDTAYVVTNTHVVDGAEQIEIMLSDGNKVVGELVGSDTYSDIAVVKIAADKVTTVAEFADSDTLTVGETAIAIGSPLGTEYANSVTQGIVSSLSRTVTMTNESGQTVSTNAIQTDAAINPGNSGGALINIQGQVIGINSSKISSTSASGNSASAVEGMGFAIPANDVVKIINQLETNGQVTRPALGISMVDLSNLSTSAISSLNLPNDVTSGVVVASVQSDMPAQGKLEEKDVITAIAGTEITSVTDLQSALYSYNVGDSIEVTFYRGQSQKTVTIELSKTSQDLSSNN